MHTPVEKRMIEIPVTVLGNSKEEDTNTVMHIEAYVINGLALHTAIGKRGYTITHINSGIEMWTRLCSKKAALVWLEGIAPLLNWSQTYEDIMTPDNLPALKIAACKEM
jgi:hypothetical protein